MYLNKLGTAKCGAYPTHCARVSCSHNCGMYLCSTSGKEVHVSCEDIVNDMDSIAESCGQAYGDFVLSVSGRMTFDNHYTYVSQPSC